MKCENFSLYGMTGCLEGEKEYCYECSDKTFTASYDSTITTKFKKSNGKCCQEGYNYDTTLQICVSSSSSCKTFDFFENCLECADGFYMSTNKCCPLGTAEDTNGDCITDDTTLNCTKWTYVNGGTNTCQACKEGFYLVSDNCCPFTYTWDSGNSKCVAIYAIDDLYNNFDVYGSLSMLKNCKNLDPVAKSLASDSYYNCQKCEDGYYLSQ